MYADDVFDSHCHLADKKFDSDLDAVIARAMDAGVEKMVCIADDLTEGEKCLQIAEKYEQVFCTIGIHPHNAASAGHGSSPLTMTPLKNLLLSSEKVKAVGEIGLDYHYDFSPRDVQQAVFREQLEIANELKLPVVVHCREAVEDVWTIVDEIKPEKLVLHCCTEKWEDVARFVERGYLLSFTGIATYPKSDVIRDTIAHCPLTQMMMETDAPYLAPEGKRGKRCEPADVIEVAKIIAQIKGIELDEVDRATTRNAVEFFGL